MVKKILFTEEIHELLYPVEAIERVAVNNLPKDLQTKNYQSFRWYSASCDIPHKQMKQKMQEWLMK